MKRWLGPFLPVEHGAWGMFATSLLLGILSAPFHWPASPAFVAASLGIFLLRNPALRWLRSRARSRRSPLGVAYPLPGGLLCGALIGIGLLPLVFLKRWALAAAGAAVIGSWVVEAWNRPVHPRARLMSELCNTFAVSLLAPAAMYVSTGKLGWMELTVWVLGVVYFGIATMDVRWRVAVLHQNRGIASPERGATTQRQRRMAVSLGLTAVAFYWLIAPVKPLVLLAFLPLIDRFRRPQPMTSAEKSDAGAIRDLGWKEVRRSLLFVAVSATVLRL